MRPASISNYREIARRRLHHFLFEYIDGGSYAEVTLRRNVPDLESVGAAPADVSNVDTSTTLFLPIILAPIGLAGMNARRGDARPYALPIARGFPFCLSTLSVSSLAEVARAATSLSWFQLYMIRDQAFMRKTVELLPPSPSEYFSTIVPTRYGFLVEGKDKKSMVLLHLHGAVTRRINSADVEITRGSHAMEIPDGGVVITDIRYKDHNGLVDHEGLVQLLQGGRIVPIGMHTESFSLCALSNLRRVAICSRQSMGSAPELVELDINHGKEHALLRPNASFDSIEPIRTERKEWTNDFGQTATGYVSYPRGYRLGTSYPMIVITHGHGARNEFVSEDFQWNYPLQVLSPVDILSRA